MPESDDQTTDDQIPEGYVSRENIRDLEAKAARASALERELAFAKALGPSDDPRLGYFQRGYDGDLSPEAIREAAKRDGFLATPQTAPAPPAVPQADLEAQARIAGASAGAGAPGAGDDYFRKLQECKSPEEVMELCARTQYPEGPYMTTSYNNQ
jgi:hypothetical protein